MTSSGPHDFSSTTTEVDGDTVYHERLPETWNATTRFGHKLDWVPNCAACLAAIITDSDLERAPELAQVLWHRGTVHPQVHRHG